MVASSRVRRVCVAAVVLCCIFTVSLLSSKSAQQQETTTETRKHLTKVPASGGAVRQLQDRDSSLAEHLRAHAQPESASDLRASRLQGLSEDREELSASSSAQEDTVSLKLRVHLDKTAAASSQVHSNQSQLAVRVPASPPQDAAQQQFVDDYHSLHGHVLNADFIAQHAAAMQRKR